MNHENMLKVADAISDLPYKEKTDTFGKPKAFNMAASCGSACCVSGWTHEILDVVTAWRSEFESQNLLGLNDDQANALFRPDGYQFMQCDGRKAAHVLWKMEAVGDGVTGDEIRAYWGYPWSEAEIKKEEEA